MGALAVQVGLEAGAPSNKASAPAAIASRVGGIFIGLTHPTWAGTGVVSTD
jgi:hypothetical protein